MNRKRIGIAVMMLVAALALSSPAAYADSCHYGDKGAKEYSDNKETRHDKFFKDLNLTADQKKMLDENKAKHKEAVKAIFDKIKGERDLMRQELQKPELDMGKINQINEEIKKLEAQKLDSMLQHVLEVRKILTPEQFKKFTEKMEKHQGKFGKRSGK